jgi:hypothetical protein
MMGYGAFMKYTVVAKFGFQFLRAHSETILLSIYLHVYQYRLALLLLLLFIRVQSFTKSYARHFDYVQRV